MFFSPLIELTECMLFLNAPINLHLSCLKKLLCYNGSTEILNGYLCNSAIKSKAQYSDSCNYSHH